MKASRGDPLPAASIRFSPLVHLPAGRVTGFAACFSAAGPSDRELHAACRTAAHWPDGFVLGVELKRAQWREPATGLRVLSALGKSGLAPGRLELGIAALAPARDLAIVGKVIDELRRFGIRVALTDCGGSASATMPAFEVDKIALAPHLVGRLGRDPQSERTAGAFLDLAVEHGVTAGAAGIATGTQFDMLRSMGCAEGLGALFGAAMPAYDIPALLRIPGLADLPNEAVA